MFYHGFTVLQYPVYRTSFLGKTPYYGYTWLKNITYTHFKYKKFIQKIQFCRRVINLRFYCFYSVKEYLSSSFRTMKQSSDLAACAFSFSARMTISSHLRQVYIVTCCIVIHRVELSMAVLCIYDKSSIGHLCFWEMCDTHLIKYNF